MSKFRWYSIQSRSTNGAKSVEIRIHDEIGADGISSGDFLKDLDQAAASAAQVTLSINSPGGDVFDAIAIYNALARYSGKITARVEGIAASAASLVLMAAQRIVMPENATIMIHNPFAIAGGDSDELRRLADTMDKVRASFVTAYAARSGQTKEEIQRMMDETTWMDAYEAQRLGFCDEVEDPRGFRASDRSVALLAQYATVPAALIASVRRAAQKPQDSRATETPEALIKMIYTECRAQGVPHLAEAIVTNAVGGTRDQALSLVSQAVQVAGLCLAAKRPEQASGFIGAGLGLEQARARLFELVVNEADAVVISNTQR